LLILHSRTGQVLHCSRGSLSFGLSSCDLAQDEIRLGAMLYALHLNGGNVLAAEVTPGTSSSEGLRRYEIGNVVVHFHEDASRQALLLLFVHTSVGSAAIDFLLSELVRQFDQTVNGQVSDRRPFNRHVVGTSLRAALHALPGWVFGRMVEASRALRADSPDCALEIVAITALCSKALCEAFSSPRSTGWESATEQLPLVGSLASLLGLETSIGMVHQSTTAGSMRRRSRGCLGCLYRPVDPAKGTARRPAPHPQTARPSPPPHCWFEAPPIKSDEDGSEGTSTTVTLSSGDGMSATTASQLHHVLSDLEAARHHRSLHAADMWWSPCVGDHGVRAARAASAPYSVVVLMRSPLLLRLRVAWHDSSPCMPPRLRDRHHGQPIDLPACSGQSNAPTLQDGTIASLAAAIQPWLAPLALGLSSPVASTPKAYEGR